MECVGVCVGGGVRVWGGCAECGVWSVWVCGMRVCRGCEVWNEGVCVECGV